MPSVPVQLRTYTETARAKGADPVVIEAELRDRGWGPEVVEAVLRDATRPVERHRLAYWTLFWALGLAALSLGSSLHLALRAADDLAVDPGTFAAWITGFLVCGPFAAWALWYVTAIEEREPEARRSRDRRRLCLTLLWCCGVVGIGRLLIYVYGFVFQLVDPESPGARGVDLLQVMVTVSLAGTLFLWAWRFFRLGERHTAVPSTLDPANRV